MLNFTIIILFALIIFGLLWLMIDMSKIRDRDITKAQIEILIQAQERLCIDPKIPPMTHLIDIQNDLEKGLA